MRFKEGDKVEFIWIGKLKQGVVTEIKASNFDISYQVKSEFMGTLWITERDLVAPAPVLKVPQFVADWYEKNKCDLEYSIWKYIRNWDYHEEDEFFNFMNDNDNESIKTLIKMQNGYEVEKEPLYWVQLIEGVSGYLNVRNDGIQFINSSGQTAELKTRFTESEIKAMDKGGAYWQFAVLVEEAEGEA
ncbi:TPA: DUF1642 domain-containing protein [Listeria monocytogenes]|uniref:Protein gp51 [Bacteriophage A118] n=1 Tax=Listeria monocytogenes serotype 1/2a (strain EGD / Mackaness) TaxID=1334565 RepID=A0A3Q0NDS0_LISMG|nr:DUF1642 domain-containing protein [Listeria monocytogenes]EAE6023603.1 DUF1642 domain-containing protein [Listeria monocytogenes serotype 3a]UZV40836.1 DUF1642 domain-containing protein [Listeria phage LP-P111]AHJ05792.1 hypothetical protein AX10_15120 [Listeria monocytogenes WSLC1001]EAC5827026.1 DUF1642 domain-containing protein [Listeria monocytogenes]EAD1304308.1 DUF1642 domain-containing protein [Listeria monocytogenes]